MRQIIAMGGGGFLWSRGNWAMERYILAQTAKTQPAVCYLPTAGGDAAQHIVNFYTVFARFECRPAHLSLFALPTADLAAFVLAQDVIYVGGGNTRSMLALWREWGLDAILRQAWEQGIVLAGMSAGAICWFAQGVTDSVPGQLGPLPGLGLLAGSCCPHYDTELERRPAYHRLLATGAIQAGMAIDNWAALHFIDDSVHKVVSTQLPATAYTVRFVAGQVEELPLTPIYLNG